jgi:hypothetical protein
MLLSIDAGFFVAYANDQPRAPSVWQELIDGVLAEKHPPSKSQL